MFRFDRLFRLSLCFTSMQRFLLVLLVAMPVVLIAMAYPVSGAIVDAQGFELPYFQTGELLGQQGWLGVNSGSGTGAGTATVQTAIQASGSHAVSVTRAASVDSRWALPVVPFMPLPQRIIQIDWDMNTTEACSNSGWGPFMGVEAYDSSNGIGLLGALGFDASTQDVLYQIEGTGALTETGTTLAFNTWHHFKIRLNFDSDSYTAFVDDALVAMTGFVDGAGLNHFTDADISALAAAADGSSQAATATAIYDNFLVQEVNGADFDEDGDVDGTDFLLWQRGFGITGTALPSDGDANGDSKVDAQDLAIWQSQFGFMAHTAVIATAVPEPTTLALLILGGLFAAVFISSARRCSQTAGRAGRR